MKMKNKIDILLKKLFQEEITSEEMNDLLSWFEQLEAKDELFESYDEKWEYASSTMNTEEQEKILGRLKEQIHPQNRINKIRLMHWTKIAASILLPILLIGGTILFFEARSVGVKKNNMIVNVDKGQKANMQLPDGTIVWLNSGSTLNLSPNYNHKERIVSLEGEAYFDVAKNTKCPFIVKVNNLSIQAIGTLFNIRAYKEDEFITTTLIEGKVAVSNGINSTELLPNERICYNKRQQQMMKFSHVDSKLSIMWKENQLAFDGESLGEIANTLERIYNVNIKFENESLRKIHFTGVIKNNSIESIFQLISITSPILYSIKDSTIFVSENTKEKYLFNKE